MAIQEFGITTADIKAQVSDLRINSASSPSTAQVTDNITAVSAQVQQECLAVGIATTGMSAGDADYETLKKAVIYKVTGELVIAKNRGDAASGAYYIERYDKLMASVRFKPDRIVVDDVGPDLAWSVNEDTSVVTGTSCTGPDFCNTIPGLMICGNSL